MFFVLSFPCDHLGVGTGFVYVEDNMIRIREEEFANVRETYAHMSNSSR